MRRGTKNAAPSSQAVSLMRLLAIITIMTSNNNSSSIAVANAQQQEDVVQPKARGLTIEECLKMISTETDTEFE